MVLLGKNKSPELPKRAPNKQHKEFKLIFILRGGLALALNSKQFKYFLKLTQFLKIPI